MSATSPIFKTKRDLTITIADGTATTPNELELVLDGEFTLTAPKEDTILVLDRGQITSPPQIRKGDDLPMTYSITGVVQSFDDTASATPMSVGLNAGYVANNWTSTHSSSDKFTVDITVDLEATDFGESSDGQMILGYCTIDELSFNDGDQLTWSISGTVYEVKPGTFAQS